MSNKLKSTVDGHTCPPALRVTGDNGAAYWPGKVLSQTQKGSRNVSACVVFIGNARHDREA